MTPEQQYLYEERWSIMHYEGNIPEAEAKAAALAEVEREK